MTLPALLKKYGSDKVGHHEYGDIYASTLLPLELQPTTLLELGTGAYWHADQGGAATRAFRDFFPNGKIVTVDIYDKPCMIGEERVVFYMGSQTDEAFLKTIIEREGRPDVIIDDASHVNPFTLVTFDILFPQLKGGGFYFIEDVHTSYWEALGADGANFYGGDHAGTVMNYFKALTDSLNYGHSKLDDMGIHSITFYREIIVIKKKDDHI